MSEEARLASAVEEKVVDDLNINDDSDDEEWEIYAKLPHPPQFSFYQYGFHSVAHSLHALANSFQHLGSNISEGWHELHENYNKLSTEYVDTKERRRSPSPTRQNVGETGNTNDKVKRLGRPKSRTSISPKRSQKNIFDVREFQKTKEREKLSVSTTIARFRPKSPTWDSSFYVSKDVEGQLYRTPCRDPTGKLILSLARDEAKGVPAWKTPQSGQDLAPPSFSSCSESYQQMVLRYMDEVIEKVQREYKNMPEDTQVKATLKARAGADLNNLIQERDHLKRDLEESYESHAKAAAKDVIDRNGAAVVEKGKSTSGKKIHL